MEVKRKLNFIAPVFSYRTGNRMYFLRARKTTSSAYPRVLPSFPNPAADLRSMTARSRDSARSRSRMSLDEFWNTCALLTWRNHTTCPASPGAAPSGLSPFGRITFHFSRLIYSGLGNRTDQIWRDFSVLLTEEMERKRFEENEHVCGAELKGIHRIDNPDAYYFQLHFLYFVSFSVCIFFFFVFFFARLERVHFQCERNISSKCKVKNKSNVRDVE